MTESNESTAPANDASASGYCPALKAGFEETTLRVQEMHHAIARKSFWALQRISWMAKPTQLVESVHNIITDGIYAAIRHGGGSALAAATILEQQATATPQTTVAPPSRLASGLRSALNAAVGDYLTSSANPLALRMGLYVAGRAIPLTWAGIEAAVESRSDRICVFIHGLGCDEYSWQLYAASAWNTPGQHYGALLQNELGYTPFYLRYNTGLSIGDNGQQFAHMLHDLLAAYGQPVRELVLVAHSMGGLVARSACDHAAAEKLPWLALGPMVICLGTPHLGAPLEKLGHLTTTALNLSDVTIPLGKIAAVRSAGVRDLRHGLASTADLTNQAALANVAYRFIGANLFKNAKHPLGHVLGDGLVPLRSAAPTTLSGDVAAVRLGGLSHMRLLNDPQVYQQIKHWLTTRTPA